MASTTLTTLWQRLADELGPHQTASVSTVAVGPDPARWLVNNTVMVAEGASPRYIGYFVGITSGVVQYLRVLNDVPELGAIMLDGQLGSGTAGIGVTYEVTWPLPLFTTGAVPGLAKMIQQACRDVSFVDRIDLTTVAGSYLATVSAQLDWLDSENRVVRDAQGRPGLYDPSIDGAYPGQHAPWRYGQLRLDGGSVSLQLKRAYLSSGATAQLEVIRPAYSLVNGAESTTGPAGPTNTIGADPTEVVAVAKLKAYQYLATAEHITSEERQRYAALVGPQEAWVRGNVRHYLPRDEMPQMATRGAA